MGRQPSYTPSMHLSSIAPRTVAWNLLSNRSDARYGNASTSPRAGPQRLRHVEGRRGSCCAHPRLRPISGAHLNPAVTLTDAWQDGIPWSDAPAYIAAQIAGASAGVATAISCLDFPSSLLQRTSSLAPPNCSASQSQPSACSPSSGVRPLLALRRSLCRQRLHHRGVLVHCINILRQSSSNPRPIHEQHLCQHPAHRRGRIRHRPTCRGVRRNTAFPLAHPVTQGGGFSRHGEAQPTIA